MPDMFTFDLSRSVYLIGEVNQFSCAFVIDELLRYDRISDEDINLIINSEGGMTVSMFGVIDTMRALTSKVNAIVLGEAASAASAIFVNATGKRVMSENSSLMFHNVSAGTFGDIDDMKDAMKDFDTISEKYLNTITRSITIGADFFKENIFKKDWSVYVEEAISYGMADLVLDKNSKEEIKLSECVPSALIEDIYNIELIKVGSFKGNQCGKVDITSRMLSDMVENFNSEVVGREISLDYTHDNDSGEKKAGAWIKKLSLKGEVVIANVEYTPLAEKMVKDKEYKYVSAEINPLFENHEGKFFVNVLTGGTLTNRPVVKGLKPIKLAEQPRKETEMKELKDFSKDEIISHLNSEHNIDVGAMSESIKLSEDKVEENKTLKEDKEAAEKEVADLKEEATAESKKKTFEGLMAEGKVVKVQEKAIMTMFKTAEDMAEYHKDAPANINMKAKGADSDGESGVMTKAQSEALATSTGLPAEAILEQSKITEKRGD